MTGIDKVSGIGHSPYIEVGILFPTISDPIALIYINTPTHYKLIMEGVPMGITVSIGKSL